MNVHRKPTAFFTIIFRGLLLYLCCNSLLLQAQPCSTLGQTPATAFPVCGTAVFSKGNVPSCTNRTVTVPGCNSQNTYTDANPFYYRFTCFRSGTLGLLINPVSPNDDYDWQIWDITGIDPSTVLNIGSRVVAANWSGLLGQTGTSNNARNLVECGSFNNNNPPRFSRLPTITAGRTYLLMVSNFSNSQQGYQLSFGGGTAVITDPKEPLLQEVSTNCGGDQLRLKLNKKMKCSSISVDGTDIAAFPGGITATRINPIGCNSSFETDSVVIFLSAPLSPGSYTLQLQNGTDGNTFVDVCDRAIPLSDQLRFTYLGPVPTPFDSLAPVSCAPQQLRFVFKRAIRCSSIDPAGSDFSITGSYPVNITGARGNCNAEGLTSDIIVTLAAPLQRTGNFLVTLRSGFDGNTLVDECNQVSPAASLPFSVRDTVNADFTFNIRYGCLADTVDYLHPGGNEINSWRWSFGGSLTGSNAAEQVIYRSFDTKTTTLIVSNGFCSDTVTRQVDLDNFLQAAFSVDPFQCPNEPVNIRPAPISRRPLQHSWNFGNGTTSTEPLPAPPVYPQPLRETRYTIRYTVTNNLGCTSTAEQQVTILPSCRIDVPNAFTPNGDGLNDSFGPANALKASNFTFRVFNRWGELLYETTNWRAPWDGRYRLQPQPAGTYVWELSYVDSRTGIAEKRKGTVALLR